MKKTEKIIAQPAIGNPVQHIRRTNRPRQTNPEQTQTIPSASITTPTKAVLLKKEPMSATKLRICITFVRCALSGYQGHECIKSRNSVIVF